MNTTTTQEEEEEEGVFRLPLHVDRCERNCIHTFLAPPRVPSSTHYVRQFTVTLSFPFLFLFFLFLAHNNIDDNNFNFDFIFILFIILYYYLYYFIFPYFSFFLSLSLTFSANSIGIGTHSRGKKPTTTSFPPNFSLFPIATTKSNQIKSNPISSHFPLTQDSNSIPIRFSPFSFPQAKLGFLSFLPPLVIRRHFLFSLFARCYSFILLLLVFAFESLGLSG